MVEMHMWMLRIAPAVCTLYMYEMYNTLKHIKKSIGGIGYSKPKRKLAPQL